MSEGRWFSDNVAKKTRNSSNMLFWHEPWLGWDMLEDHWLLNSVTNKNVYVKDMMSSSGLMGGG